VTAPAVGSAAALYVADATYRAIIARTALGIITIMRGEWASVDPDNLAGSSADWLQHTISLVLAGERSAIDAANSYTAAVRRISVPGAPAWRPTPIEPPTAEQVRSSIIFTGLAQTGQQLGKVENDIQSRKQNPEDPASHEDLDRQASARKRQLMETAIQRAAGAATRYITTAGRDQLVDNVQKDDVALGWARTTKAGCCYFCAMLASRGPVYKKDSFKASNAAFHGVGDQKVHDNCGCGLRPLYSRDDPLPERTDEFEQLWIDKATGSGAEAIRNFRRAYEGREKSAA
jgi:hypothetical protein